MARNKYNAKRVKIDNIWFDSKKEGLRYIELKLMLKNGDITDLGLQTKFELLINGEKVRTIGPTGRKSAPIHYRADFTYRDKDNAYVVEDVKGYDTYTSRLKRALVEAIYSVNIRII